MSVEIDEEGNANIILDPKEIKEKGTSLGIQIKRRSFKLIRRFFKKKTDKKMKILAEKILTDFQNNISKFEALKDNYFSETEDNKNLIKQALDEKSEKIRDLLKVQGNSFSQIMTIVLTFSAIAFVVIGLFWDFSIFINFPFLTNLVAPLALIEMVFLIVMIIFILQQIGLEIENLSILGIFTKTNLTSKEIEEKLLETIYLEIQTNERFYYNRKNVLRGISNLFRILYAPIMIILIIIILAFSTSLSSAV